MLSKEDLRRQIRELKRQFTAEQLAALSIPVLERLRPYLEKASVVLAYYSLPDEVDTHQLLERLVAEGKTVLLPKVMDGESMVLCRYASKQDLQEGPFRIMEPVGEPFTDYGRIDMALIPGIAFDAQGRRLGRGRGYYDRLLAGHPSLCTIGLCFDFQKVGQVPISAHDRPVDIVI